MKKIFFSLIAIAMAFVIRAQELKYDWGVANTVESYTVGPGMKYTKVIYPQKPVIVWLVEVDLTNPYAKIEQAQSRHQVPDVLRWDVMTHFRENSRPGHQVKVAWNHDFFSYDDGICIGLNICEGEVTYTKWGRSILAITDEGKAEVFLPNLNSFITTQDGTNVTIDIYNAPASGVKADCTLFNSLNGTHLSADGDYIAIKPLDKWRVNGDPIRCLVTNISSTPIQTAEDQYVIFLQGGKRGALDGHIAVGETLTITQTFNSPGWGNAPQNILNAFHGYPSIVHDGVLHDGEFNNFENGREYELSSRVMAGISQDKTKLYIATTELSSQSAGVDCIELSAWLVERGAWDVVNFDSGGSAAIVIDEKMLNLPGRGSVRPVVDAALAISLAPEDKNIHHLTFSLPSISPMVISRTPLRVMSFNQYDEVLDSDLQGCSFTVEPESIGYVDDDAIFHASEVAGSGKIIARYADFSAELAVNTIGVTEVKPGFSALLVDDTPRQISEIYGVMETGKVGIDVGAFAWTSSPEGFVDITPDGVITGLQDGETTVTGSIGDVSFSFPVTVQIVPQHYKVVEQFSNIESGDFKATFSSAVKNKVIDYTSIPTGWTSGANISFDLTTGRGTYVKFSPKRTIYSLPDALTLKVFDSPDIMKTITFQFVDAMGKSFSLTAEDMEAGDNLYRVDFKENEEAFAVYRYPITLQAMTLYLTGAAVNGCKLAIGDMTAIYPGFAGVDPIVSDSLAPNKLDAKVLGEQIVVNHSESVKSITIFNSAGIAVASAKTSGENSTVIDAKCLPLGIYFVTAYGNNSCQTAKILIK